MGSKRVVDLRTDCGRTFQDQGVLRAMGSCPSLVAGSPNPLRGKESKSVRLHHELFQFSPCGATRPAVQLARLRHGMIRGCRGTSRPRVALGDVTSRWLRGRRSRTMRKAYFIFPFREGADVGVVQRAGPSGTRARTYRCGTRAILEMYCGRQTDAEQNRPHCADPISCPVLDVGVQAYLGDQVPQQLPQVARDVRGAVIPAAGHNIALENPAALAQAYLDFFAGG